MVTIIDYGMGNLGSIHNMFNRIKIESEVTSELKKIEKATKILLPGVGAFDAAMQKINDSGLRDILDQKAMQERIPILGICLGMQLLTNGSEEGNLKGFGWIPAKTIKFRFNNNQNKIPHMGWNLVYASNKAPIIENLPEEPRFYFVHSYYVKVDDEKNSLLKTNYGGIEFDSAVIKDNIFGAQFHPEKSHKFGMKLLENFGVI